MLSDETERAPEECIGARIEARVVRHTNGSLTGLLVTLHRADGEDVPIYVATLAGAIELVRSMNPPHVTIRADGGARRALFDAFADAVDEIENDSMPPTPPTLH